MKRMEINGGGGWRWMKRMEMDEEDGDKWRRMEMDEEDGDEWVRVKVRVRVRF